MKRIFETVCGIMIGVVEEPENLDPNIPIEKQMMVKIGAIEHREVFPDADARIVTERLRDFVTNLLKERKAECLTEL